MNIVRRLVLALLLVSLTACTGMMGAKAGSYFDRGGGGTASSDGFPAPSLIAVWQASMQVVKERGFVPDPEYSDSISGKVVSRWKTSMQPMAGTGFREKVDLAVLAVKGKPSYFRIETNVTKQMNDNMTNPSSRTQAEWRAGTRDQGMERLLNNTIEMMFLPSDVSPQFRRSNNMRSRSSPRDPSAKPPEKKSGGILGGLGLGG